MILRRLIPVALFVTLAIDAGAHSEHRSRLVLDNSQDALFLEVDVAASDLALAVEIDSDGDGRLTEGELNVAQGAIRAYLTDRIEIRGPRDDPACVLTWDSDSPIALQRHHHEAGFRIAFEVECAIEAGTLHVSSRLFHDVDHHHETMVSRAGRRESAIAILSTERPSVDVEVSP